MAISLGRDAGLTWDGVAVPGVRDVTVSYAAVTREFQPFGSRTIVSYHTGYSVSLTVETIDDAAASTAVAASLAGTEIAVVAGGHTFTAVVVNVSDAQPLDDVRAYAIQMQKTTAGLRS
jgi:hypothetical protein